LNHKPRIIFAGTPEFAAVYLDALIQANVSPVAVYTQPDRRSGRGKKITPSAVKQLAIDHQIEVFQPLNFNQPDALEQLQKLQPDILIVVAYGLLLPQIVLDIPTYGCVNAHASLLPRWRGAAPIQRAIEAGDKNSGVCLMQMEKGLDTGPILATTIVPIEHMTSAELHQQLAQQGAKLLIENLDAILAGKITAAVQDEPLASYAHKLSKAEALLNWQQTAVVLERQIRAFNPWPVSHFHYKQKVIRVWAAEVLDHDSPTAEVGCILESSRKGIQVTTAAGVLNLTMLQLPGKKALSVAQIIQGNAEFFEIGSILH